jgi:hypothetical protein
MAVRSLGFAPLKGCCGTTCQGGYRANAWFALNQDCSAAEGVHVLEHADLAPYEPVGEEGLLSLGICLAELPPPMAFGSEAPRRTDAVGSTRTTCNLREAATELGVAPSTVRKRILDGRLKAERDGARWVIYPRAIAEYRESRRPHKPGGDRAEEARPSRVLDLTPEDVAYLERCGVKVE